MKVIIAGSRNYPVQELQSIFTFIGEQLEILKPTEVVSGGARGIDAVGELVAHSLGYKPTVMKAQWHKLGKRAGQVRNKEMARYVSVIGEQSVLILVWDGKSKGSANMKKIAEKFNFKIIEYIFTNKLELNLPEKLDENILNI